MNFIAIGPIQSHQAVIGRQEVFSESTGAHPCAPQGGHALCKFVSSEEIGLQTVPTIHYDRLVISEAWHI